MAGIIADDIMTPVGEDAIKELDLYDDFLITEEKDKCDRQAAQQQLYQDVEKENKELKIRIGNLEQEIQSLKRENNTLKRNISILYKTAKLEIERKNNFLRDLQERYDSLVFRRRRIHPKTKIDDNQSSNRSNSESATSVNDASNFSIRLTMALNEIPTNTERITADPKPYPKKRCLSYDKDDSATVCSNLESANAKEVKSVTFPNNAINFGESPSPVRKKSAPLNKPQENGSFPIESNSGALNAISLSSLLEITKLCNLNTSSLLNAKNNLTDEERVLAQQLNCIKSVKEAKSCSISSKQKDIDQNHIQKSIYNSKLQASNNNNKKKNQDLKVLLIKDQITGTQITALSSYKSEIVTSAGLSEYCVEGSLFSSSKLGQGSSKSSTDRCKIGNKHGEVGKKPARNSEVNREKNNDAHEKQCTLLSECVLKSAVSSTSNSGASHESLQRKSSSLDALMDTVNIRNEQDQSTLLSTMPVKDNECPLLNVENKNGLHSDISGVKYSECPPNGEVKSSVHLNHEAVSNKEVLSSSDSNYSRQGNSNKSATLVDSGPCSRLKNESKLSMSQKWNSKFPEDDTEKSSFNRKERSSCKIERTGSKNIPFTSAKHTDQINISDVSDQRKSFEPVSLDFCTSADSKERKNCSSHRLDGLLRSKHKKKSSCAIATDCDQSLHSFLSNSRLASCTYTSEKRSSSAEKSNSNTENMLLKRPSSEKSNKCHHDHKREETRKIEHCEEFSSRKRRSDCRSSSSDRRNHNLKMVSRSCDTPHTSRKSSVLERKPYDEVMVSDCPLEVKHSSKSARVSIDMCESHRSVSSQPKPDDNIRCIKTSLNRAAESPVSNVQQQSLSDSDYEEGEIRSDEEAQPDRRRNIACFEVMNNPHDLSGKGQRTLHSSRDCLKNSKPYRHSKTHSERSHRYHEKSGRHQH